MKTNPAGTTPQTAEQMVAALQASIAALKPEFAVTVYRSYSSDIHAQFPATSLAYAKELNELLLGAVKFSPDPNAQQVLAKYEALRERARAKVQV